MSKKVKLVSLILSSVLLTGVLSACGSEKPTASSGTDSNEPYPLSIAVSQGAEAPQSGNEIQQALEKYTKTKLSFQWIPGSGYDDKINVMLAAGELPKLVRVSYTPTMISAMQEDQFWEVGPYLKDYKNLSAQPQVYYDNISVQGKIYGIPVYRNIARAAIHYRKDWFDAAGLSLPKSLDDWYNVVKAVSDGDPDGNGKKDTYGLLLDKNYNKEVYSTLTRISVAQGGVNKWGVDDQGNFTPEFMTDEFVNTMKLFKRFYDEKLINQDFAVTEASNNDKAYESGHVALRISGGNAQSMLNNLVKVVPTAEMDVAPLEGPGGIRVPGESGNAGMFVIPKSAVSSEEELKQILTFLDQLLDKDMVNLINKGIEGKHYKIEGGFTVPLDPDADLKEVKPYRDTLLNRGDAYNMDKKMKTTDLAMKNTQIVADSEQYAVPNPALNLLSTTYAERGSELEQQITDAETKFIMGKIDEAGWQEAVEKWKKDGGDQLMEEYKAAYLESKKLDQ